MTERQYKAARRRMVKAMLGALDRIIAAAEEAKKARDKLAKLHREEERRG